MNRCSTSQFAHILAALLLLTTILSSCVADQPFSPEDIDTEVAQSNEVVADIEETYCGCYLESRHNGNLNSCKAAAFGQRIELTACQRNAAECYAETYIRGLRCQRERLERFGDCIADCPSDPSACEQQFIDDTCPTSPERDELNQMMQRCANGSSTLCNR